MKKNIFLLCILSLMTYLYSWSQIKFSCGPELGMNYPGFPSKAENNSYSTYKKGPVKSVLLGAWTKANIGKYVFADLGVQYFRAGIKSHSTNNGTGPVFCSFYYPEYWLNQT